MNRHERTRLANIEAAKKGIETIDCPVCNETMNIIDYDDHVLEKHPKKKAKKK